MNKRRTTIDRAAKEGNYPFTYHYEDPNERREDITKIVPASKRGYWMAFGKHGHFLVPMGTIIYIEEQ